MDNAAQKVKDWWEVADRTQRMVTIFGAAALVVLLVLTAYVMSQPRMTMLASGLSAQDQATAVSALTSASIPVDFGPQSSILVPSNKIDEAKGVIGNVGITAPGDSDAFTTMFGGSVFEGSRKEGERIRLVKERELAKTIMTWEGVSTAIVHMNIEEQSAFVRSGADQSSATVSITESSSGFGASGGKAVAKLVQTATGIQLENITVVNNLGQLLFQGDLLNQAGSTSGMKLQTEIQEARRRERDLARSLDLAFGPGNTIAMIQVELDMDIVSEKNITRTPSTEPYSVTQLNEEVKGGSNQSSGGGTGAMVNLPPGSQPAALNSSGSDAGSYIGDTSYEQFNPNGNVKESSTVKAPGAILAMTVQVVVNSAKVTDVKAVESIANNYLGANLGKTGFAATVTAVEFDTETIKALTASADSMKSSALLQQIISLLPVLALVVVGFLVIRAISKAASKTRTVYALAPAGPAIAQPQYPTGPTDEEISKNLKHEAFQDMPAPETEAGQALASAIEGGDIHDALKIIEEMPEDDEIKAIRARINVPLEQIKHMAKTKPESVAMLLKGWMLEDLR